MQTWMAKYCLPGPTSCGSHPLAVHTRGSSRQWWLQQLHAKGPRTFAESCSYQRPAASCNKKGFPSEHALPPVAVRGFAPGGGSYTAACSIRWCIIFHAALRLLLLLLHRPPWSLLRLQPCLWSQQHRAFISRCVVASSCCCSAAAAAAGALSPK